jgi:DNA-binding response OmpR family regulator
VSGPCVLVIDDNAELRAAMRENLELDGYTVFAASAGAEGLNILRAKRADMILLDLGLPDGDGLALIAAIRALTDAPLLVVSGKGALVDKVVGLEMGADDYLAKPFEMKELSARVKAGIRRYRGRPAPREAAPLRIRFGRHVLDTGRCQAFDDGGNSCDLTTMEFRLLEALVQAPQRVLTREALLDRARANNFNVSDRAIDIQITRIRRKIGDGAREPRIIQTVRGIGYVLACETEEMTG